MNSKHIILFFFIYISTVLTSSTKFTIVVHGGAGGYTRNQITYEREVELKKGILEALRAGYDVLKIGGTHLEATEHAVIKLEDNPLFNAGRGARINRELEVELDASVMDGATGRCGGIAAVKKIKNPIKGAKLVMEQTEHILMVGHAMDKLAEEKGLEIVDNSYFFTIDRLQEFLQARDERIKVSKSGTVGSVALDIHGNLSAMTSTGGFTNKMSGRVGDSPIIGAGNYANNETLAISCTGHGEVMMKNVLAYDIHARMKYTGVSLKQATHDAMSGIEAGTGGLISVDKNGDVEMPYNSPGMWRGYVKEDGKAFIALFGPGEDYTATEYDMK
jgi:beta-aspartyl-peptidase (threonine type)